MPAEQFWGIIERAAQFDDDPEAHMEALSELLRELPLEDIIAFEVEFRRYLNDAYTWELCGAASLANSGTSDDGFEYFRRWLVSKGRAVYEAALLNPDNLAQFELRPGPGGDWSFESIYYVAQEVFAEKGGEGYVSEHCEPEAGFAGPPGPSGEPYPQEDGYYAHLAARYPNLWKRFGRQGRT